MKQVILLVVMILMLTGTVVAEDPNRMNPVTIQRDPNAMTVTVTFYMVGIDRRRRSDKYEPVSDAAVWGWANDPDFLATFQEIYLTFPRGVRNKIKKMTSGASWDDARAIYDKRERK